MLKHRWFSCGLAGECAEDLMCNVGSSGETDKTSCDLYGDKCHFRPGSQRCKMYRCPRCPLWCTIAEVSE